MTDPNPQTTDDDKDNPFKGFIAVLKAAFGKSNGQTQGGQEQNPLAVFFTALISFFKMLMGGDADPGNSLSYDDNAGLPGQPTETRQQAEARQQQESKMLPKFSDSARELTTKEILHTPTDLLSLKNQAEAANGGRKLQAIMPIKADGIITSPFGEREAPMKGASTEHKGLDIAPTQGGNPDIIAPMPGKVVGAGWMSGYGNTVDILDIYGVRHRFGHLKEIDVKEGQMVQQGEKVAVMGMTGNATGVHVHYEQRDKDNVAVKPVIMGQVWAKSQSFTKTQNLAFLAGEQNKGGVMLADASSPALGKQLLDPHASLDEMISGLNLSFAKSDKTYVAPNTGATKSGVTTSGRAAGV
jgi:murein DD-endopeptidase MepM/ murein hydrolase activator NlpD